MWIADTIRLITGRRLPEVLAAGVSILVIVPGQLSSQALLESRLRVEQRDLIDTLLIAPREILSGDGCDLWINDGAVGLLHRSCSTGKLTNISRAGKGPGDFQNIAGIMSDACGGVVVFDALLRRLTTFDQSGRLAGTTELGGTNPYQAGGLRVWMDRDRVIYWREERIARNYNFIGSHLAEGVVESIHIPTGRIQEVTTVKGAESFLYFDDRGKSRVDLPFAGRTAVVWTLDGLIWVVHSRDAVAVGLTSEGEIVNRFAVPLPKRRVTDADRIAAKEIERSKFFAEADRMRYGPEIREFLTRRWAEIEARIPIAPDMPTFEYLLTGPPGELWMLSAGAPWETPSEWIVISTVSGKPIRKALVPHTGHVVAATTIGEGIVTIEVDHDNGKFWITRYSMKW